MLLRIMAGLMFLSGPIAAAKGEANRAKSEEKPQLVSWASPNGVKRLGRSQYKADFFALANQFESQPNKMACGPTTTAIVMNALQSSADASGLPKTQFDASLAKHMPDDWDVRFNRFTPHNLFAAMEETKGVKSEAQVYGKPVKGEKDYGMQLRQLHKFFESLGAESIVRVVGKKAKAKDIRDEIRGNLATSRDFVVVNYSRKALGQKGGGHISPLGAYDEKSDSFLVLDVNPNKANWVWVKTEDLVDAMRTFDTVENRGYLLVTDE